MHNTPSDKAVRYLRRQGVRATTTPDHAARHIAALRRAGMRDADIATAATISPATLYRIAKRHTPTISRAVEQRILTVPVPDTPCRSLATTPAHGTARRLQALAVAGYPPHWIARQLHMTRQQAHALLHQHHPAIALRTETRVTALYLAHWDQPPAAAGIALEDTLRAQQLAAQHAWVPAAAWDDIDHPDTVPDLGGHVSRVRAVVDDAAELAAQGYSREGIAARLGIGWDAVRQAYRRDGSSLPAMLD